MKIYHLYLAAIAGVMYFVHSGSVLIHTQSHCLPIIWNVLDLLFLKFVS